MYRKKCKLLKYPRLGACLYKLKDPNCSSFRYAGRIPPEWLKAVAHSLATSLGKPVEFLSNRPLTQQPFKAFSIACTSSQSFSPLKLSPQCRRVESDQMTSAVTRCQSSPNPFVVGQSGEDVDVTPFPSQLSRRTKVSKAFSTLLTRR